MIQQRVHLKSKGKSHLDSEGFLLGSIVLASLEGAEAAAEVTATPAALSCRDTEKEARISCSSSALRLCVSCSNVLYPIFFEKGYHIFFIMQ